MFLSPNFLCLMEIGSAVSFFQGALAGGISGVLIMSWWCLTAQYAIAGGEITHEHKPLTVVGCSYNYTQIDVPEPSDYDIG